MSAPVMTAVEIVVALLLLTSGAFSLIAAIGILRLKDFFQRMHPPALASTLATWSLSVATVVFFSALESRLALHALILNVLLAITMPVTTLLLARAALFRKRQAGEAVPPALGNGTRS